MVNQPPIEGNLDCQARSFHSELCFDRATFRLQPKLRDSFHLLQRYHMEHLMTPRDFFYPRVALDFYQSMTTHHVWDPTVIHFTIDGCHGILGARHSRGPVHSLWASTSRGLSSVGSSFSEWHGPYTVQRGIHKPVFVEEGALSQYVLYRCTFAPQHLSTSTYGAKERSFARGIIPDIRGIFLWPSSSHNGRFSLLWREGP